MKTKKLAPCPKCCPAPRRADFVATYDFLSRFIEPVWECTNCCHRMPRRVRPALDDHSRFTRRQIAAITRIQMCQLRDDHEVKTLSIRNGSGYAWVYCVVGMRHDEGTFAAVLCRTRGLFCVGRGGKIKALYSNNPAAAKRYPLIWGWTS